MLKLVWLARRQPHLTHEELAARWGRADFSDLGPDRHRLTIFDPHPGLGPHQHDGMAVLWFDDDDRGRRATAGMAEPPAPDDSGPLFEHVVRLETDEHVLHEGDPLPAGARKLTFLVVPRAGTSHADVVRHWVDVHGPNVAAPMASIPGALRYVASPAVRPSGGYAGVTELWYADRAAAQAHAAALSDDGFARLADNTIFLTGREVEGHPPG